MACARGNHNGVGWCDRLELSRQIWSLADRYGFMCSTVGHDQTRSNADPQMQWRADWAGEAPHRTAERKPCAHGPFHVVLVRLGVTEMALVVTSVAKVPI